MTKTDVCPICNSKNIELVDYVGSMCVKCKNCGFDEVEQLLEEEGIKPDSKTKAKYSPYRTGGPRRVTR